MDFFKVKLEERQNSTAAWCMYSAPMIQNEKQKKKNLSCGALTAFNCGMMENDGG